MWERLLEVQFQDCYQTHDVQRRVENLGEVEQQPDRTTKLRAQGPRNQVVSSARLYLPIGADSRETECCNYVDQV